MWPYGSGWVQKYSDRADRFIIHRSMIKEIFVDETLLRIDGQDYWLWIAYEPNLNTCLMMHLSQEKELFSFVINSSDS
jgi:transposase-like protein